MVSRCLCSFRGPGLGRAELSFDFSDPLAETAFDFRYGFALAEVSRLVKVLQIGAQFLQQFLGESLSHSKLILHLARCADKITRNWDPRCLVRNF